MSRKKNSFVSFFLLSIFFIPLLILFSLPPAESQTVASAGTCTAKAKSSDGSKECGCLANGGSAKCKEIKDSSGEQKGWCTTDPGDEDETQHAQIHNSECKVKTVTEWRKTKEKKDLPVTPPGGWPASQSSSEF